MCMRNSAYLTEARERDRRKGNLSTRNNNNLHDSVSDKDEYDTSNCAAAVVVYVVVYALVQCCSSSGGVCGGACGGVCGVCVCEIAHT